MLDEIQKPKDSMIFELLSRQAMPSSWSRDSSKIERGMDCKESLSAWSFLCGQLVGMGYVLTTLLCFSGLAEASVITPVAVTASSFYSVQQVPVNLINGNGLSGVGPVLSQTHNNNGSANGMWHSDGSAVANAWVEFDLGAQYSLTAADIWQMNQSGLLGRGAKNFAIYTSPDASSPITNYAGSFVLNQGSGTTNEARQYFPFNAGNVRRVKIAISNDWNGYANDYVGLSEVRFEGLVSPTLLSITNGLGGYWKFDESSGSTAVDSSGSGRTGTVYNNFADGGQWTTGKVGGGLRFRGPGLGNDYVRVPGWSPAISNSISLSAWVMAGTNQNLGLIGAVENTSRAVTSAQEGEPLSAGGWHHVVMVADSGNLIVYHNGMPVGFGSYDGAFYNPSNLLVLGARLLADGSAVGDFWQGTLDEVALWTRPLTGDDVFKVFAAGHNGAPVSSADSYSNSPPLFVSPPPGGSFYLNQPISLVAEASGFGMLTYQWWKDGSPLAGGDSPVYSHAANSDAVGQYSVVVTDGYGRSATSAPAAVTIISPSLSIASLAGGVKLSWPGAATSYHLESAPEPSGPWTVVASSQTNSIVIPATNSASFYRLHVN